MCVSSPSFTFPEFLAFLRCSHFSYNLSLGAQDLVLDALTACMSVPEMIDESILESDAKNFAQSGDIDPISALASQVCDTLHVL